jgi:hypothetical protein
MRLFAEIDNPANIRGPGDSGITIVVSPLIPLMKDQIDALTKRGVSAGVSACIEILLILCRTPRLLADWGGVPADAGQFESRNRKASVLCPRKA